MEEQLLHFLQQLGIETKGINTNLLIQTFTHKSFSADTIEANIPYNERLEFLGDSILGACVADTLFATHPEAPESKLTLAKIWLVQE
jgi:ribonuclease-3